MAFQYVESMIVFLVTLLVILVYAIHVDVTVIFLWQLFAGSDEESDLSDNFIVKTCQKFIPVTGKQLH